MRILCLVDPNSIHDQKWLRAIKPHHELFLICRSSHYHSEALSQSALLGIELLQPVEDFSIRRCLRTFKNARNIRAIIQEKRIDLFYIIYAEPNALWANFKNYFGCKMMLSTRGTDILVTITNHFREISLINRLVAPLYVRALRRFDQITSTSQSQIRRIHELTSITAIELVRTGVDVEKLQLDYSKSLPESLQGKNYVFFPRVMKPIYNHIMCLEAIRLLPAALRSSFHFVFVGKDGGNKAYIQEFKQQIGDLRDHVVFLETQMEEAMISIYQGASLVVIVPTSDGSPVSAMEAMICKTPLILGPLTYDRDLFDGVLQMSRWDAAELSNLIKGVLDGEDTSNKEALKQQIITYGDAAQEMHRLNKLICNQSGF